MAAQFMTTLAPKTVLAFDEYLRGVDTLMTARAAGAEPLAGGAAGIHSNSAGKEVSHGMVHDWSAVAFVPGGKKSKAIALLEDFSRHTSIYPEAVEGRVERREGDRIFAFHRLKKKKVLEVNLEVRYQIDVLRSPEHRYCSRSIATNGG